VIGTILSSWRISAENWQSRAYHHCRVRTRVSISVVYAVLTVVFLSGCSGQRSKPQYANTNDPAAKETRSADACSLLTEREVADIVGNTVNKGRNFTGTEDCKWDTEEPENVDVLLIVHAAGSIREQVLCADLGKADNSGQRVAGMGDIAVWKFSKEGSLFNSGDLEVCGPKGFVSLTLQGKQDESTLKQAAISLATRAIERL